MSNRAWEKINNYTFRLWVPGGWLVTHCYAGENQTTNFVPDVAHHWVLEEEEKKE